MLLMINMISSLHDSNMTILINLMESFHDARDANMLNEICSLALVVLGDGLFQTPPSHYSPGR